MYNLKFKLMKYEIMKYGNNLKITIYILLYHNIYNHNIIYIIYKSNYIIFKYLISNTFIMFKKN